MNIQTIDQGLIKINGRLHYFRRLDEVSRVRNTVSGRTISGIAFNIEGGKKAGGTSRDWFLMVDWDGKGFNSKPIICTSIVDALTCINNA